MGLGFFASFLVKQKMKKRKGHLSWCTKRKEYGITNVEYRNTHSDTAIETLRLKLTSTHPVSFRASNCHPSLEGIYLTNETDPR
jgi:hypothetical protein